MSTEESEMGHRQQLSASLADFLEVSYRPITYIWCPKRQTTNATSIFSPYQVLKMKSAHHFKNLGTQILL